VPAHSAAPLTLANCRGRHGAAECWGAPSDVSVWVEAARAPKTALFAAMPLPRHIRLMKNQRLRKPVRRGGVFDFQLHEARLAAPAQSIVVRRGLLKGGQASALDQFIVTFIPQLRYWNPSVVIKVENKPASGESSALEVTDGKSRTYPSGEVERSRIVCSKWHFQASPHLRRLDGVFTVRGSDREQASGGDGCGEGKGSRASGQVRRCPSCIVLRAACSQDQGEAGGTGSHRTCVRATTH
jgi:hypothetical protein